MKGFKIAIDDEEFDVFVEKLDDNVYKVQINDKTAVVSIRDDIIEFKDSEAIVVREEKARSVEVKKDVGRREIKSMLPGTVMKILVKEGDKVNAGNTVLILEAMKMENEITSPFDGIVKEIRVKSGDRVDTGDVLVVIE
ncbi:hypothetical protein Asulf_02089 [Archaeoglobus sulfaticallidus PM70-1]|uniref:Lipoyl-binding domain-containing protein n=1 Tax=Archaeoglobus sulfaticallidus PM70-1 TaxID=387631 RepID=N0BGD7_9EURY|nr:biotin/lipoyl-containing protein [Archaeoglobus sulfaticallidus]AGK62048.1 hypothetical protein Asulf_02089 [Archaeoglobus sulfaticallidus PM70-1]